MVKADPDRLLNRLVVAALTIFIVVLLLLAALVFRQIWVQQQIAQINETVQINLEDLETTTEEIQSELSAMRTATDDSDTLGNLDEISELLGNVDEQLSSLEEEITEVSMVLEPELAATMVAEDPEAAEDPEEDRWTAQDPVDQVFTIFAALIGLASIAIAILLGMAVRVQRQAS